MIVATAEIEIEIVVTVGVVIGIETETVIETGEMTETVEEIEVIVGEIVIEVETGKIVGIYEIWIAEMIGEIAKRASMIV